MKTREMSRVVAMTKDSCSDQVAIATKTSKSKNARSKEDTKEGHNLCSLKRTSSMNMTLKESASLAAMMPMDGLSWIKMNAMIIVMTKMVTFLTNMVIESSNTR